MKYDETEIRVRFNEVDSWGMVWHGHYIAWFEVGRMALLGKFQLLPQDFTQHGLHRPGGGLEMFLQGTGPPG